MEKEGERGRGGEGERGRGERGRGGEGRGGEGERGRGGEGEEEGIRRERGRGKRGQGERVRALNNDIYLFFFITFISFTLEEGGYKTLHIFFINPKL